MFNIIFYYDHRDHSDVEELLNTLRAKAATNKTPRIEIQKALIEKDDFLKRNTGKI